MRPQGNRNPAKYVGVQAAYDHTRYFGAELSNHTLTPDEEGAIIAVTTFDDWLKRSNATRPSDRSAASASPPAAR